MFQQALVTHLTLDIPPGLQHPQEALPDCCLGKQAGPSSPSGCRVHLVDSIPALCLVHQEWP